MSRYFSSINSYIVSINELIGFAGIESGVIIGGRFSVLTWPSEGGEYGEELFSSPKEP
jgi:hypothetical protein